VECEKSWQEVAVKTECICDDDMYGRRGLHSDECWQKLRAERNGLRTRVEQLHTAGGMLHDQLMLWHGSDDWEPCDETAACAWLAAIREPQQSHSDSPEKLDRPVMLGELQQALLRAEERWESRANLQCEAKLIYEELERGGKADG
jgi:hypothetical protein